MSQLPFPDNTFDLVTAVETQYYRPDLGNDMKEVRRVLKPGGTLVISAESYQGGRFDNVKGMAMKLLRTTRLSVNDHRELFATAGYTDIQTFEEKNKGWFCGMGQKTS